MKRLRNKKTSAKKGPGEVMKKSAICVCGFIGAVVIISMFCLAPPVFADDTVYKTVGELVASNNTGGITVGDVTYSNFSFSNSWSDPQYNHDLNQLPVLYYVSSYNWLTFGWQNTAGFWDAGGSPDYTYSYTVSIVPSQPGHRFEVMASRASSSLIASSWTSTVSANDGYSSGTMYNAFSTVGSPHYFSPARSAPITITGTFDVSSNGFTSFDNSLVLNVDPAYTRIENAVKPAGTFGLSYTNDQINQLYALYYAGTGSTTIGGSTWRYFATDPAWVLAGHPDIAIGESYTDGLGHYYMKLGSGEGNWEGGGGVPEPSSMAVSGLAIGLFGLIKRFRKARK